MRSHARSVLEEWLPVARKLRNVLVGQMLGLLGDVYYHMHVYNESQ